MSYFFIYCVNMSVNDIFQEMEISSIALRKPMQSKENGRSLFRPLIVYIIYGFVKAICHALRINMPSIYAASALFRTPGIISS